jgi:hypothetical protein
VVSDFNIPELNYYNQAETLEHIRTPFIDGYVSGTHGRIPRLKTTLDGKDRSGTIKVRLGFGRDNYMVPPGLYAVGNPNKSSPILATANYKLTVDMLRCNLQALDIWIMVIDTKGINVWCAAGKGTFGTYEIIKKIKELKLKDLVNHRTIILPQLCAPGVAAYQVLKNSGFKAIFGPIKAEDIKGFIGNGMKATEKMRTISFDASSRLLLTPIEVVHSFKLLLIMLASVLIYNIVGYNGFKLTALIMDSLIGFVPLAAAVLTSCIIVPFLLPYIPFRAFAAKGLLAGIVLDIMLLLLKDNILMLRSNLLLLIAYCIIIPTVTTLLSLNFTGSTTYTSFSGVKKETKITMPIIKVATVIGVILALASRFL